MALSVAKARIWAAIGCGLILLLGALGCDGRSNAHSGRPRSYPYRIVTTTGMVSDIVRQVAGDKATVNGLMGEGVDPHLYKPTRDDIAAMTQADVVIYSGLMLEGKLTDTLVKLARSGRPVHAVTEMLEPQYLLEPPDMRGHVDPHVWMDPTAWAKAVEAAAKALAEFDPPNAEAYRANAAAYIKQVESLDEYAKQVYHEQQATADHLVPMGRLAAAMGVVPGTATSMVKALADSGLVVYEPRGGVRLTRGGEQLALHVLRRHRLLELFLVKALGLDWSEVHEEAEQLEHAISDKVLDRIDTFLGHPSVDPHGDPIPTAKGKITDTRLMSLLDCPANRPVRVARIIDQDAPFLQFVHRCGLIPGVTITVQSRDPSADAVAVLAQGRPPITLGTAAAVKVLVEAL